MPLPPVLATLWFVFRHLITDRAFHAGMGSGSVTLTGAYSLLTLPPPAWVGHLQVWVVIFATLAGGVCSIVATASTVLKIRALLSDRRRESRAPFMD